MNVEDTISKYPNELAHIRVDMQNRDIEHISENAIKEEENEVMARKRSKKSSNKSKNELKKSSKEVNFMWKCMSLGKIDISYACVGYSLSGQPVLDYSIFVDLLVNYGFAIQDVMSFINEFAECAKEDNTAPIIMTNSNVSRIMTEIKPIVKK